MNKAERGYANVSGVQGEIHQPSIKEIRMVRQRKKALNNTGVETFKPQTFYIKK